MRDPFTFLVAAGRRKPFRLDVATTGKKSAKLRLSLHCPVVNGRVRMPVQGPFRAAVESLIALGAIVIPDGGKLPPAAAATVQPKAGA